jgi:hypothetical protein
MSQTYFSKLDSTEKQARLNQLGSSQGMATIWVKGTKTKHRIQVKKFHEARAELVLDANNLYPKGTVLLCSFDLRGMSFFCEALVLSVQGDLALEINKDLFKSEKRKSYRLLTFPVYEVSAEFNLEQTYLGGKVIDIKSRTNQTALFKSFLKLVDDLDVQNKNQKIKYRVQDLSTSGMSLQIGELDSQLFSKDYVFKDVCLHFKDEAITIPEVKVVYIVDYILGDRSAKKYKVGLHFNNIPLNTEEQLGAKINILLREVDSNKDFENFIR